MSKTADSLGFRQGQTSISYAELNAIIAESREEGLAHIKDKANARHMRLSHAGPDFEDCGTGTCDRFAWLLTEHDDDPACGTCGKRHR